MKNMYSRTHWLLVVLLCGFSGFVCAAPWRSSLYPADWSPQSVENKYFETDAFIQDFSLVGYRYGATPSTRPQAKVFDVTQPPFNADNSGQHDSTAAIQAAINAAAANTDAANPGGIVYLPAGTYHIAPQSNNKEALRIANSHIVLRGDGAGKTYLLNTSTNMREKRMIRVRPYGNQSPFADSGSAIKLSADVLTPTKQIALETVDGLSVGQWVVFRNDITEAWANEHNEPSWTSEAARKRLRGQSYIRRIEAIDKDNKTITIEQPLRYYLKTRDQARLYPLPDGFLQEVGLEGFSIAMQEQSGSGFGERDWSDSNKAAYQSHASEMIAIVRTLNGWARNIRTYQPQSNPRGSHFLSRGVVLRESAHVSLIDMVIRNTQYGGGGGNGYGFTLDDADSNLLLQTKAQMTRHGYTLNRMGSSGNVFHQCVDVDTGFAKGDGTTYRTDGRASDTHSYFSHANLFDDCRAVRSAFESRYRPYTSIKHALTSAHGVFWNLSGEGQPKYISQLVWSQQARYGYVIGTSGDFSSIKVSDGTYDERTAPMDIAEGEGQGGDLQPQSLWLDQRQKRYYGVQLSDGFEAL